MRNPAVFSKRPVRRTDRSDCRIIRESDFRLVADRVENLSSHGMLVGPADAVMTGEIVLVSFRLPETDEWFDVRAVVKRVSHGRRPGETRRQLGLEFLDVLPFDQYRLRKALSMRPPVPPGMRPGRRQMAVGLAAKSLGLQSIS